MQPQGHMSGGESLPAFPASGSVYSQPYDENHEEYRDWTDDLPDTDHIRFFRETDWSHSSLGPLESWSPTLRLLTRMVLADTRSACLWWGPDLIAIYNEAYKWRAGLAHPYLMGKPFREGYPPEMWHQLEPYFKRARESGQGYEFARTDPILVERHGWREETFFSASFVPVGNGPTNQPEGFYNSLFEITGLQITERRTAMLNRLAAAQEDLEASTVWPRVLAVLETNGRDVPMAILYENQKVGGVSHLRLRGQLGLPSGHGLLIDGAELTSDEGIVPECRRATMEAPMEAFVIDYDDRFACIKWRGYGAPCQKIAILPIANNGRNFGYLVIGVNPLRPYNEHTKQFLADLRRMVTTVVETAVIAKEGKDREYELSRDLEESDLKLRHLIEHSAVGMMHMTPNGDYIWANEQWNTLHGIPPEDRGGKLSFFEMYADDEREKAEEAWEELKRGANHVSLEVRLKRFYTTPLGDQEHAHIQILAFPYREHGRTKGIMAAATDISHFKWAQNFQARLAAEAREAKRQQEAFIDVVSHEMRNPLSAIMHCADEITKSLEECRAQKEGSSTPIPEPCLSSLTDNVNAAQIIMQCVNHQKRIIDDVLTLSRLDSMLLSITPSSIRPMRLINPIVGLFEAELRSNHIAYNVQPDDSIPRLQIEHLYLDPSRVTQIFINLITNAIKFTKNSANASISISFGATTSDPHSFFPADFHWAAKGSNKVDVTDNPEWGDGEVVFLTFMIKDTGIGMTEKEIQRIFSRFKQANMRTHVKYGGSGLGLFISKELAEKQGGEIGVSSLPGQGSTFGFYIRTKRGPEKAPPENPGPSPCTANLPSRFETGTGSCSSPSGTSKPLQVLLVEDNVVNQQVLVRQLKKAGLEVDVANQGLEALSILENKTYDVVLMDLEMPVMDGLTAMREIRRRQAEPTETGEGIRQARLPIIAVTANVRKEQIDTAIEAGADKVMQKPFKAVDLVRMMKGLIPQVQTPTSEPATPGLIGPMNELLLDDASKSLKPSRSECKLESMARPDSGSKSESEAKQDSDTHQDSESKPQYDPKQRKDSILH